MGIAKAISYKEFPSQSNQLNKRTWVCFNYDIDNRIGGTVVRDDLVSPFVTIIKLDDGRYVNSTECQYTFPKWNNSLTFS